jgi:hypothetical protein
VNGTEGETFDRAGGGTDDERAHIALLASKLHDPRGDVDAPEGKFIHDAIIDEFPGALRRVGTRGRAGAGLRAHRHLPPSQ